MKKALVLTIAALAIMAFTTTTFAAKVNRIAGVSYTEIEGQVVKLIPDQSALIVKDSDDGKEVHIHVDSATLAALQSGDTVKFNMQGSNCIITNLVRR